jgi:TatA/E family protein of Tat protein translocase
MIGFKELLLILLIILLVFGAGKLPAALKSIMQSIKDLHKKD